MLGLKPWVGLRQGRNLGSKIVDSKTWMAFCTILSLGEPIVSGLSPPDALGIWIFLPGLNSNFPVFSSSEVSIIHSQFNPSNSLAYHQPESE